MKQSTLIVAAASLIVACGLPATAQAADKAVMTSSPPGQAGRPSTPDRRHRRGDRRGQARGHAQGTQGQGGAAAGPEVRNLEQVKVGDSLKVTYVEALSLTLKKDGKELRAPRRRGLPAPGGQAPGGAVAEQVEGHRRRDRGRPQDADGHPAPDRVDLYVADPAQLKLIKVGDQIEAKYTQAVAITVEAAKK